MLKRVIPYAHELIQQVIQPGEIVIDATCGNGHDTVMLSQATGPNGVVYAFDIQAEAITNTKRLLEENQLNNVELIHDSHQYVDHYLDDRADQQLAGAIFNLGYLPGSDKTIITKPTSTISAIDKIACRLKVGGIIVCVVYYGHSGGQSEKEALLDHLKHYDQKQFNVLQYGFINQKNHPPFVLALEKKQAD
ncbi:class I SAM-dependent methyltransferase [Amphibacillus jilinensis]|uniref:class I SAM-dependent methyltransferase n=1 Tax=Amphibacillus jilinensis TaxID=1216008 RepID=UPI0002F40C39|nr:class I SAM-dependent methyltransferase [Amphibacillus jilinensis]